MNEPPLSKIQSWLMTVMTSAGGVDAGLHVAKERFGLDLDAMVAHAGGAAPATRLNIYATGYIMRLVECLRADFPALRRLMGNALFDFFAKSYVWAHPSSSPSLFDLGAGFPDFLQQTQRERRQGGGDDPAFRLPIDLARLERARTQASRARGLEGRAPHPPADPLVFLRDERFAIVASPCLHLLELSFPLKGYLETFDRGADEPPPEPLETRIAIGRMNYRVSMAELQPWQFAFIAAARTNRSVHHCALRATEASNEPVEAILAGLIPWLPAMFALGILAADDNLDSAA
jgi:Putative DNA-binding domain